MVQIVYMGTGPKYPEYKLIEKKKKLVIENLTIDLEENVQDSQNVINITRNCCDGSCILGLEGKAGYVADIAIPPREYKQITTGEGEEATIEEEPIPLDLNAVTLTLWPYGADELAENEMEGV